MVSTIHETVDDETHERLYNWKEELDLSWREFFDYLAHKQAPEWLDDE